MNIPSLHCLPYIPEVVACPPSCVLGIETWYNLKNKVFRSVSLFNSWLQHLKSILRQAATKSL